MMDNEIEAMYKCHESVKELDEDAKIRVFKYLLDRYNLIPNVNSMTLNIEDDTSNDNKKPQELESQNSPNKNKPETRDKPKKKTTSKKSGSTKSYSLLSALNLVPKEKESLEVFYSKYDAKNNMDKNIIILYYLKNILGEENVGVNHIYTCYKHLNMRVPNIEQSLRDIKSRKGWIDITDYDDLKIPVSGENYMEHQISTKN